MKSNCQIILFLMLVGHLHFSQAYRSYDGYKLFHILPSTDAQLRSLKDFAKIIKGNDQIEFWRKFGELGKFPHEIFVGPMEQQAFMEFLKVNEIGHHIEIENFAEKIRNVGAIVQRENGTQFLANVADFDFGKYHRYESILNYLKLLAKANPEFAQFSTLGQSYEGRQLAMIKLGYAPSKFAASKKPIFLVDAGIHAREWIAPAVALHLINAFVNNRTFHQLLHQIDVHIVPSLNPDGYEFSWTDDRLWRRTRSGPWRSSACDESCRGVDPNRNFPIHWAETGTSPCPCSQNYPGPEAFTETEVVQLAKYMRQNLDRIGAYLTLHSYSDVIMHAWNWAARTYPSDVDELEAMGEKMRAAILRAGGPDFGVGSAPDLMYEASGSSQDYATSLGIKYSFTMELTNGHGFTFPEEMIDDYAEKVLPGILELAKKVVQNV